MLSSCSEDGGDVDSVLAPAEGAIGERDEDADEGQSVTALQGQSRELAERGKDERGGDEAQLRADHGDRLTDELVLAELKARQEARVGLEDLAIGGDDKGGKEGRAGAVALLLPRLARLKETAGTVDELRRRHGDGVGLGRVRGGERMRLRMRLLELELEELLMGGAHECVILLA